MTTSIPNPKPVVDRAIAALDLTWLEAIIATAPAMPELGNSLWVDDGGIVHFNVTYTFLQPDGNKYLRPGGFDYLRVL